MTTSSRLLDDEGDRHHIKVQRSDVCIHSYPANHPFVDTAAAGAKYHVILQLGDGRSIR